MQQYPQQPPPPWQPQQPPPGVPHPAVQAADVSAERALSAAAHGAIAFGLFGFTLPLSLLISGVIWLYSKRSPEVRFHSEQAGCYQCSVLLINVVWVVLLGAAGGFSIVNMIRGQGSAEVNSLVALGAVLFVVWFVASILYGIFAAIMVLLGKRFKYPLIGNRFEKKV